MGFIVAYAFDGDRTLEQILTELRERTDRSWRERDSFWWGDYLSARWAPGILVKIFVEEPGYLLEIAFEDDDLRTSWERSARQVVDALLPLLDARNVRRAPANN